ncbi:MAG: energy transducer TonB [Bacteroidota bacterium]|nr:energy transducer TonB [Bacteroidota bacterium]MDX5431082.1 energy transducer TonB [Bacteroidota bacterium]MDX5469836.1 energy transducer TonB [Bacteroidota bacterium]
MELRKYPEADIRKKTDIYFMIGLTIALGTTYLAFSISTSDELDNSLMVMEQVEEVEEMTEITRQDQPPPPPPPPPQTIEVVEDDSDVEEADIDDTEIDQETVIEPVLQEQVEEVEQTAEPEIFMVVEDPPQFPGGEAAMLKYIADNLEYPPLARENNISGRVVVQFVVDENGKITQAKIIGKPLGWGCDEAALKVVNSMPRWKPGKQRNKAVRVRFVLPIRFVLG